MVTPFTILLLGCRVTCLPLYLSAGRDMHIDEENFFFLFDIVRRDALRMGNLVSRWDSLSTSTVPRPNQVGCVEHMQMRRHHW